MSKVEWDQFAIANLGPLFSDFQSSLLGADLKHLTFLILITLMLSQLIYCSVIYIQNALAVTTTQAGIRQDKGLELVQPIDFF